MVLPHPAEAGAPVNPYSPPTTSTVTDSFVNIERTFMPRLLSERPRLGVDQ